MIRAVSTSVNAQSLGKQTGHVEHYGSKLFVNTEIVGHCALGSDICCWPSP
jgi:hypothetical protein